MNGGLLRPAATEGVLNLPDRASLHTFRRLLRKALPLPAAVGAAGLAAFAIRVLVVSDHRAATALRITRVGTSFSLGHACGVVRVHDKKNISVDFSINTSLHLFSQMPCITLVGFFFR